MRNFIANKYKKTEPSAMLATTELAKSFSDTINLSIGDPDLRTDKIILDGCYKDMLAGHTHYGNPLGYEDLRKALLEDYKEEYGVSFNDDEILITSSATHAMFLILHSIINQNDEVIIFDPYFTPYEQQITLHHGKAVSVRTYEENNYQLNEADLEAKITKKTKAIILNNPANPSGVLYNAESYNIIKKIAIKYDLLIIADDIYTIFTYENKFVPINTLEDIRNRVITIKTFSKDFCMTGFRIGYVLGSSAIINVMNIINENVMYTAPSVSQRAALYAIKNKREIQNKILNVYKERISYVYNELKDIPNISLRKPEGSIYLFINIKKTGMTSTEFTNFVLNKYHILVLPGIGFGEGGEGYVRIALTVSLEKLKEAIMRIKQN